MSYATVAQYVARYGSVSDTDMLQECLNDCSALIDMELESRGIDVSDIETDYLMRACRSMAKDIMPDESGADIPAGATQASFTAGPYSQQFTLAHTYGTPKLNAYARKLLGIGARIGFGALAGADGDD